MTALMYVLRADNEENAVVALKIIVELHKTFKIELEDHVQSFFDIVLEMYKNMRKAVVDTFDDPNLASSQVLSPSAPGTSEDANRVLSRSMTSFKVLTECPIIIALLLQVHRNFVNSNVPQFVPLIMEALMLQPAPQKAAHERAAIEGKIFCGVSSDIRNRVAYSEFKALQVKTASFIAYILRSFQQTLRPYQDRIADAIVGLLKDCPPEASSTRKELLVAIRHIWYTEFRTAFLKHFDVLLNENVLIGSGVTAHETLRPLAHSILIDLIHHIRMNLNETQLSNTIHMYARNLHDDSLAPNIQNLCAKLLVNLVECLGDATKPINRSLLMRILEAFALKFTSMKNAFPCVMKHYYRTKNISPNTNSIDSRESSLSSMDGHVDLGVVQPIKSSMKVFDSTHDLIKDMRFLLKTVIQGLKPVLLALKVFNPPGTGVYNSDPTVSFAAGFSADEVVLICRILKDGLKCFDYFISESFGPDGELLDKSADRVPLVAKEEKEVFESFAAIFTYIEPCVFQDVFSTQMPYLFERILLNGGLQAIPQYLLGLVNPQPGGLGAGAPNFTAVSPHFGGLLLRFLVDRIENVSGEDQVYSASMLRLFKVVFMAVTKYPEKNEAVLKPHVGNIIMKSMKLSATARDPLNYFLLLRALFRSIGGGRFEALYQEVLPLLEVLLEGLNVLLSTANKQSMKELFVELCLTVPVRLNVLLPYLSFLMKPLVLSLCGPAELVSQGLRTLELCIDNLTQDFLEPIIAPQLNELMEALWRHLKPLPYKWEHSHTTLRILGKLGGRNRRLLTGAGPGTFGLSSVEVKNSHLSAGLELLFAFNQSLEMPNKGPVPAQTIFLDPLIRVAFNILEDVDGVMSDFHVEHVFIFAQCAVPLLVAFDEGSIETLVSKVLEPSAARNEGDVEMTDVPQDTDLPVLTAPIPWPTIDPANARRDKLEARDKAFSDIMMLLFICTGVPCVSVRARALLENICRHFAFLAVAEAVDLRGSETSTQPHVPLAAQVTPSATSGAPPSSIDHILNAPASGIDGFVSAVVRSMTSENRDQRQFTESALKLFHTTCSLILARNGRMKTDELPVFNTLASKFSSCCYKPEWFEKSAGCLGISLMTVQMDFGLKWMLDHELEFIKALLYVLKDVSPEMATVNAEYAKDALLYVLKVCNSGHDDEMDEIRKAERSSKFSSLVSLLICELSNSNASVRETIQEVFKQLATLTGTQISDMLTPVRERLLQPIFSKPLRALPFALQIGHIDAITYCLNLRPSLLQFEDQLIRLLSEALALADAEDQALVSKPSHYKNSASLTNLRVVCVKLLSAAMACSDFSGTRQVNTRARIIAVFFKQLYSKSSEVVDVAYQGLALVLSQQQKLPKELLQAGLKPILVNLQEYKRLTVSGLEGLARLLELLTSYFKVEIGKKLLDHCRSWAEPPVLANASGKPLTEIEEIKIMVGILNVFHLLPAAANCFMEELVKTVLDLEAGLRRTISSPFRLPLVKFLNRYAAEAVDYFLERMGDSSHFTLFASMLTESNAEALRSYLLENPSKFIKATFEKGLTDSANDQLCMNAVNIVRIMSAFCPEWLLKEQELGAHLRLHWANIRNSTRPINMTASKGQEYRYILEIFIIVATHDPSQYDILCDILKGFDTNELIDVSFLKMFFHDVVALQYSAAQKRAIMERFWKQFSSDEDLSDKTRTLGLRYMIIPMLQAAVDQKNMHEIVDADMISLIHVEVWQGVEHQDLAATDDFLRAELVQLTTLLIQSATEVTSESRKEVIKWAWNQLKVEDVTCKQAAYVALANFIHEFETPPKIAVQIFVALLKAHQAEIRVLVKQALDVLFPVAPKRVVQPADAKLPAWVRWTKKVIVDDGHNMSQLLNMYQALIRHAELFYPHRDNFITHIVSSFSRLGLLQNATAETRTVSIDLCELILKWEKMRVEETGGENAMAVDDSEGEHAGTAANFKETTLGYLIRFVSSNLDPAIRHNLVARAVTVFKSLLELWSDVNIRFVHFEKALALEFKEETALVIRDSIDMLQCIVESRTRTWILANLTSLQKPIEQWVHSDNPAVVKPISQVLDVVCKAAVSAEASDAKFEVDVASFFKGIESVTAGLLQNTSNVFALVSVLQVVANSRPEVLDERTLSDLMKLLTKLTKDHLPGVSGSSGLTTILIMLLELVKNRLPSLKDYRRQFHEFLMQLIGESQDLNLLHCLLNIVEEWIFKHQEPFPTLKEKAALVQRMMVFETRGDKDLLEKYLLLVSSIYNDARFTRSELTVRLEKAFLLGSRSENPLLREKFSNTLNASLEPLLFPRLNYVIGIQNWEFLSNTFWIRQALDILLGSIDSSIYVNHSANSDRFGVPILKSVGSSVLSVDPPGDLQVYFDFLNQIRSLNVSQIIRATREFSYLDSDLCSTLWISLFSQSWNVLTPSERERLSKLLMVLLGKEMNLKQKTQHPNVVATLLDGAGKCVPPVELAPYIVKYAGKNFNAWHTALEILQSAATAHRSMIGTKDEEKLKDMTLDCLTDLLGELCEEDYVCGTWRRRCLFDETNAAISFEQAGLWAQAQTLYETAQSKARSGFLPFTEAEYNLWEDHWINCAKKLQQWDILTDLAKHEGNTSLFLESAWRLSDWNAEKDTLQLTVKAAQENNSPRQKLFEAFLALLKVQEAGATSGVPDRTEFKTLCDEGIQLTLQSWQSLPKTVSTCHIPLLHIFQLFVEIQEAAQMQENLLATNISNIETKSQELKGILITWRERLPNVWDDITLWSDMVAWRQHVFSTINTAYSPLIPQLQTQVGASNTTSSYAFRGYHETAWIINRFSHVARKHQLTDVCVTSLTKIYTLPNIEIPEAFYKLREQAKCHFQSPLEYPIGLDVINNTNLHYFSKTQSAEFFTLKGVFLAKMELHPEAVQAFSSATQMDMGLAKAWAAWGHYNDQLFKENPTEVVKYAVEAVQCYLQAAGIYNNARSRKYIARIIWLMGLDDASQSLSKTFENYKSDTPLWYWTAFIPQLLSALSSKEARYARAILMKIAKSFPQSLHFQLRTTKEEFMAIKKQAVLAAQKTNSETPPSNITSAPTPTATTSVPAADSTNPPVEKLEQEEDKMMEDVKPKLEGGLAVGQASAASNTNPSTGAAPQTNSMPANVRRQPWEYLEEIMALLKTAFPLLTLSMETMVDQINQRLKPSSDEDIYRLVVALLNDSIQQFSKDYGDVSQLSPSTEQHLLRFSDSLKPNHMKYKPLFEEDFIKSKPSLTQLIDNFRNWRDKLEIMLDSRPRKQHLEYFSHYLVEFEYQKFDEIEVPGQYFLLKDSNKDFIRIDRFQPDVEVLRGHRRLTVRGHDGSLHPFVVQHPAARSCRREERIVQLFRIFNGKLIRSILERKKESRRRGLQLHLPIIVPLAPLVRIVQDDPSYKTLQDIYEEHCSEAGIDRDEPILSFIRKMREMYAIAEAGKKGKVELLNLKTEIMEDIAHRMVPDNILTKYMMKKMKTFSDLWNMRKHFTGQMAAVTVMTYLFSIGHRTPQKFNISMRTGDVWSSDLLPSISNANFLFHNIESVPFRLTPNIQHFITPIGMEGVFTSAVMSIARGLTEPEPELEDYLSIFVRDELVLFKKPVFQEQQLRDLVNQNCDLLLKRSHALACKIEREKGAETAQPANQTVLDLVSQAANPLKLAQMEPVFMPML
ncbi:hypothetical protein HDU83_005150 [Entophlyctis luteolus]|nr:hypothetical protein HDU83_005150 [Entophlyctis luteolus]